MAGKLLRREANRLDFRHASQRVANVDGAPWIREQLQLHLAELDGLGLDFYHLGENAHRARRGVFGEDSAEGKTQCKLTVCRLKGRSRRWDRPNAAAVAALDSLERSRQWQLYWKIPCATAA